jgi:hypothetical protein
MRKYWPVQVGKPEVNRGTLPFRGGLRILRGFCYTLLAWQEFLRSLWPGKPVMLDTIWFLERGAKVPP